MVSIMLSCTVRLLRAALLILLTLITSCESRDQRLADFAARATEQQARQNERLAEQSRDVARQSEQLATTAHKLVEQNAAARRELLQTQHELQRQFLDTESTLDRQRQQLHLERSEVAVAAVRDPVIARSVLDAGLILAALLPLILTAYALRRLPEPGPAEELLLESLWQAGPPEPRPPLPDCAAPRLTAAESSGRGEGSSTGE